MGKTYVGLRSMKYALLTESTDYVGASSAPTYGTIYSLPGAARAAFDSAAQAATYFGDDGPFDSAEGVGDMKLTIELGELNAEDEARLLGHTYSGGSVLRKSTDSSPLIAVMFQATRSGATYENFVYYKCRASKPSLENQTKSSSLNLAGVTLELTLLKLNYNDAYRLSARSDDASASATFLSGFFTAVPFQSADLTALSCTVAAGTAGDAGKIIYTFAKGSGASFSLNTASVTTATLPTFEDSGGVAAGAYVIGSAGTTVTVAFTPTVAYGVGALVGCSVLGVKDNSGVSVTQTGDVITST